MEEDGGEGDFFDDEDDKNSQTGFSEYLVKGTITSAIKPKNKAKAKQQKATMMQGASGWGQDDGMLKRDSKVAGLDTLSAYQNKELDDLCKEYEGTDKKLNFFNNFNPKKVKLTNNEVRKVYMAKQSIA